MSAICTASPFTMSRRGLPIADKKWIGLLLMLAMITGFLLTGLHGFAQLPARPVSGDLMNIKGSIADSAGNRLTGVTVQVNGTKKTTTTNNNGEFELTGVKKNAILTLSIVGFKTIQVKASETVAITMKES